MLAGRGVEDVHAKAARACGAMRRAFDDALVNGWEPIAVGLVLPDLGDVHVLAAAIKTRASIIVTDNLRDFPAEVLAPLDLEAKSTDTFLADTIDLDEARAVVAVRTMRQRLSRPEENGGSAAARYGSGGTGRNRGCAASKCAVVVALTTTHLRATLSNVARVGPRRRTPARAKMLLTVESCSAAICSNYRSFLYKSFQRL